MRQARTPDQAPAGHEKLGPLVVLELGHRRWPLATSVEDGALGAAHRHRHVEGGDVSFHHGTTRASSLWLKTLWLRIMCPHHQLEAQRSPLTEVRLRRLL